MRLNLNLEFGGGAGIGSKIRSFFGSESVREPQHAAASRTSDELARWNPSLLSADQELLPERETLIARTGDMIRNNGIASGAVQIHLDNIIGSGLKLCAKPDRKALNLSDDAAAELESQIETGFRAWADDIDCYCDASRHLRFAGLLSQGYRSYLSQFEILATSEWLPDRGGKYATAIQMIDPVRLSTPHGMTESDRLKSGIVSDPMGAAIAYYIENGSGDPYASGRTWKRIARETEWGRQQVIHVYDVDRPGQSRGKNGIVSVLAKMKMLERYEKATLDAAILNAIYAAIIESPLDWQSVGAAIGAGDADPTAKYMQAAATWHNESRIRYNGLRIPHLFPGEKFELKTPQHPHAAFNSFEEAVLRYIAAGLNLSYEQLSRDYSKTNYSSARAAMLEAWRFFSARIAFIAAPLATAIYALWLEEELDKQLFIKIPAGVPDFQDAKSAWCRCDWIGPPRGHVDPFKEASAEKVRLAMGTTTLERLCHEQGLDWREVMAQRAEERRYIDGLMGKGTYDRMTGTAAPAAPFGGAPGGGGGNNKPGDAEVDDDEQRQPEQEREAAA